VTGSETVTLTATTKLLNKNQTKVLVDGDSKTGGETGTRPAATKLLNEDQNKVHVGGDSRTGGDAAPRFDSKLSVSASGPLKSS